MNILGISAYYHDSAACLVRDGTIIAAAQEERFSRKRHDASFPKRAITYCLREGGITIDQVDSIAFYEKPFIKFNRILETYLQFAPRGLASFMHGIPLWIGERLWMRDHIATELGTTKPILFTEHHESHAASAFFVSPFERAAFLTVDGVGEWATATYGVGEGSTLRTLAEQRFPHSLGLLYSAFTYQTGFKVNSGEYKVMGLAPYGEPKYVRAIYENLIDVKDDGSFTLNMEYFDYCTGLRMTNEKFDALFGGPPRVPESLLTQREMDLARSIQDVTDDLMIRMARHVHTTTGERYLCMAGGVALNCVANGKILRERFFDSIWIQPAAGDAGGAIGAALLAYYDMLERPAVLKSGQDLQQGSYLGPAYSDIQIEEFLRSISARYVRMDYPQLLHRTAESLRDGLVVGWFQGRMEFGPRALGNRSILGDARNPEMQKRMNIKIKFREGFRPFAPAVLAEDAKAWFEIEHPSPYMLLTADVAKDLQRRPTDEENAMWGIHKLNVIRSTIPAVTHIDYSARLQTVHKETNPLFHALIAEFKNLTGCPVVVNTSFNVRGEPIVESPADAYRCFMRTGIDVLVMGTYLLKKEEQPVFTEAEDWRKKYELD